MYPCTKCGCCCKRVNVAVERTKDIEGLEFPYKWDETGRCEMLTDDNLCSVYDDRPLLCNIDKVIEVFKIDKKEFYKQNTAACNELMDLENIPISFRIKN